MENKQTVYESPEITEFVLKNESILCQSGTEQYQLEDYNPWI